MNIDQYSNYGAGKVAGAIEERERIMKLLSELEAVGSLENGDYLDTTKLLDIIDGDNK